MPHTPSIQVMRRGRLLGIAGAASAAAAVLAGCGAVQPRTCAGPAEGPPGIQVDAAPWLSAHRGASVEACLASHCSTLSEGKEKGTLQAPVQDIEGTYTLTVRSGGVVVAEEQIHLADQTAAGPCGTVHVMTTRPLTLGADGRLIDPGLRAGDN